MNCIYKQVLVILAVFLVSACGGSGGGDGDGNTGGGSSFRITEENANVVASQAMDSTATILKLGIQLQEALDATILSGEESYEFYCDGSGSISIDVVSEAEVLVKFNSCENSQLEIGFSGQAELIPESVYSNSAQEVFFQGRVNIDEDLSLHDNTYVSVLGSFTLGLQATWYGDVIDVKHISENPLKLRDESNSITFSKIEANIEYDLDQGLNMWPRSNFFGEYSVKLNSSLLGGEISCDTKEPYGMGAWNPKDFEIYCSDSNPDVLLLSEGYAGGTMDVSILDADSQEYRPVLGMYWNEFESVYEYQPGFPQPTFEVPGLPSIEFSMDINDAVYSSSSGYFYIAIPDNGSEYANHLIEYELSSMSITRSLALKGEAGPLAISGDGAILYLGYINFPEVQRVDLSDFTLSTLLDLGEEDGRLHYPRNITVSPAANDTVAVATYHLGFDSDSKYSAKIKFFRDGVEQSVVGDWFSSPTRITFDEIGSRLITYTDDSTAYDIDVFSVGINGLDHVLNLKDYASGPSDILMYDGALYNGIGTVVNPDSGELYGRNSVVNGYDNEEYRKLAPLITPGGEYTYIFAKYLEIYDRDRYTYLGVFDPGVEGKFLRLININDNKFAFVTDAGVKIFSHQDVPVDRDANCGQYFIPDMRVDLDISFSGCLFGDAVYSAEYDKIYASIPGVAGVNGNSIAVINRESLNFEKYIPVGSEPYELEISKNDKFLYISYLGTNKYSVLNLNDLSLEMNVDLGTRDNYSGPIFAGDLEPFPTDEGSVLISTARQGYTTDFEGMEVYVDGIKLSTESSDIPAGIRANRIRFAGDNLVFGYNTDSTGFEVSEFKVDSSGVTFVNEYDDLIWGFPNEIAYSSERLYSSLGYVINTDSMELVGQMEGLSTDNWTRHHFVIDENRGVMYLYASMLTSANDPALKVFSLDTFEELASVKMPTFAILLGEGRALIDLNEDELLVVLGGVMYKINKDDILH
ncbi:YncE family protein [Microbulbifer sp. JMSA003]|uniref:YncE family protein n=1 Tax=Microbulbifer sp. JMSA003 TaxID=3243369 RepID=UPI00403A3FB6